MDPSEEIGQTQVTLGTVRLGGNDLHLASSASAVIIQRLFPANTAHGMGVVLWREDGTANRP